MTFGLRLSFATGAVLDSLPGWADIMTASRDEKLRVFGDKNARNALNALTQGPENKLRTISDWGSHFIYDVVAPDNQQYRGQLVGTIAHEQGRDPFDLLCEIAVADELRTSFGLLAASETDEDWKARLAVWRDRRAVIGASDAGAHYDLLATFNYATVVLQRAVREREILSFEEAIHLMTQVPAELYGLRERGQLRQGWYADVVVIDPHTGGTEEPRMRFDLPGESGRLYASSTGMDHVLVNGKALVTAGALTANRPGNLLRSGRATSTPSLS